MIDSTRNQYGTNRLFQQQLPNGETGNAQHTATDPGAHADETFTFNPLITATQRRSSFQGTDEEAEEADRQEGIQKEDGHHFSETHYKGVTGASKLM